MDPGLAHPDATKARGVQAAAERALEFVADGSRVGLGTGRAAAAFIAALGERVRRGLHVVGVPTSQASARQARALGIPLIELGEGVVLDVAVDGADEVSPDLDLVKGRGGALVRERIVAAASRRQIILVGREKLVRALGEHGPLPIEVIPFGVGPVLRSVKDLGLRPSVRSDAKGRRPRLTENGNVTLDCMLDVPLPDRLAAAALERALRAMPGVVDTGLFLGTATLVLVGGPDDRVDELRPERS
jgi:ribose 5-phosphate isomerase A